MAFSLKDYYEALNGESSLTSGEWQIVHDKRHVFKVFSDYDAVDEYAEKISLPPSEETTSLIQNFSSQLDQKIKNTKIVSVAGGLEEIQLELEDRIITIVMDQSGSMTWNDSGHFRHQLAKELVNKITDNYPGDVTYNLISYGGTLINVLFFGVLEENIPDITDITTVAQLIYEDEADFAGVRIIRNSDHYPTSILDGEEISDGFISRAVDTGLTEGQTYYYAIFTYDKDLKFSTGARIKVTPQERNVPRGISIFKTAVETEDLLLGSPFIGSGFNRTDNTVGLWHLDEGEGNHVYDFSDSGIMLTHTNPDPEWYASRYTASGTSAMFFGAYYEPLRGEDSDGVALLSNGVDNNEVTVAAWIYPYTHSSTGFIACRGYGVNRNYFLAFDVNGKLFFDNDTTSFSYCDLPVELYKWNFVAASYDGTNTTYYVNGQTQVSSLTPAAYSDPSTVYISVGSDSTGAEAFNGRIAEVAIFNTALSAAELDSQLLTSPVYDSEGNEIDTDYIGVRDDNGDRLVVLEYEVPSDYDFAGGRIRIVKNEKRIPTWEEDGTIIYDELAVVGVHRVEDPDDFVLGETYYYRIFSQNVEGNFSFSEDSPSLTVAIPTSSTDDYFIPLDSEIVGPSNPTNGQNKITAGRNKNYLQWSNPVPSDSRIKRVKVYYSESSSPGVNANGGTAGILAYTGLATDTKFVHRNLSPDTTYYYTVVFIDKYGRASNYNTDGSRSTDLFTCSATPVLTADESIIPLDNVEDLHYELVDSNSVSVKWDMPERNPYDIEAYFDQTVLLFSSLTDEFGSPISADSPIKMYIQASITRETQGDNVFGSGTTAPFEDKDAYEFFVTRTDSGIIKAVLKMTDNLDIISQIREASFDVQIKSYIPKEGYAATADENSGEEIAALEEYAAALNALIEEIDGGETTSTAGENVFEYYSRTMTVHFTNPWEIELVNRDNAKVPQRCYVQKTDKLTKKKSLVPSTQSFNGIYMKASAPFVARAKVKYKGEAVDGGSLQLAVWDADFSRLCQNAGVEGATPYEGEKISPSTLIRPPETVLSIKSGTETRPNAYGELESVPISYVDIPLYAPNKPWAVRLFVKGTRSGYSSVKDIYILFQSVLKLDINASAPIIDGKDVSEQYARAYIVNPDYPNVNPYDLSKVTYPTDTTVVEWGIKTIDGDVSRSIYSTDVVPLTNGIYSYARNGTARSIFLGPIEREVEEMEETHEIWAKIVYEGLTSIARQYIYIDEPAINEDQFNARFMMEVDGGYNSQGTWSGSGWLSAAGNPLWSDGSAYKRLKIHRNPRVATDFDVADCFRSCATQDDSDLLELSSNQIVHISTGDNDIQIVHGEVTEEVDPYTGEHYLVVGDNGFVDYGNAYIELNDADTSDVTYFYIRSNKHVPDSGTVFNPECDSTEEINNCLCLKSGSGGITECDIPQWSPVYYISGTTTVFVNNQPLVLSGGGNMSTGIPPCPIALKEPLGVYTVWRKVINYYYDTTEDQYNDPSNLRSQEIEVGDDNFLNSAGDSYIKYSSDVVIRVRVTWKSGPAPEGTPVYVSVGNNDSRTLFFADRSIYYTEIDPEYGYSYADITLQARRVPTSTTTEQVEIFSTYDKEGTTSRRMSTTYSLTIEEREAPTGEDPDVEEPEEPEIEPPSPYSKSLERYNIEANQWDLVANISEGKGNMFSGTVGQNIYVMGGLKNNSLDISSRTEKYDAQANTWSLVSNMLTPRFAGSSITYDGKIYTFGGIAFNEDTGSLNVSQAVEVYDPVLDEWSELAPMPTHNPGAFQETLGVAFGTASLLVYGGRGYVYIACGVCDFYVGSNSQINRFNDRVLVYCIEDDTWDYSIPLRSDELNYYQRIAPTSHICEDTGKMYVFGGAILDGMSFIYPPEVLEVSISSAAISQTTNEIIVLSGSGRFRIPPIAKFQSAMVVLDTEPSDCYGTLYFAGGSNTASDNLDLIESLTIYENTTVYANSYEENTSNALMPMTNPKHGASAEICVIEEGSNAVPTTYLYVIGGYSTAQDNSLVDIDFDI